MGKQREQCPFCDAPVISGKRRCGTVGPDEEGQYITATECDKTVYRNAFLACGEALEKLLDAVERHGEWGEETRVGEAITNAKRVHEKYFDDA